ncbi:MAG: permease-like cell division protein FtsX [Proteobacteria bacterium]|nr:permease-like cell division protein FtsX [Pseudomonadota bacterium]
MNKPDTHIIPSRWATWYRGHLRAMAEGHQMPWMTPYSTVFTIITLAICFYLPLTMWVLWQNFAEVQDSWNKKGSIAVFLKSEVNEDNIKVLQQELLANKLIESTQIISKNEVYQQLSNDPQLTKIIDLIGSSQLPDQILLNPVATATNEQLINFTHTLQLYPVVEYVSFDSDWFTQLNSLTRAFYYLMQASIMVFLIIVLVVLSNTIGNEVSAHKKEINLTQLLGATAAQNRRRFLYGGVYYGFAAALLGLFLLKTTLWWIEQPIADLAESFGQEITIRTTSSQESLVFILLAIIITWFGSRISSASHIKQI